MTDPTAEATSSIAIDDVKGWRGQDVLDAQGEKFGTLDEVYYDTETDAPAFGAVKSGLVGKYITLVPLAGASVGQSYPSGRDGRGALGGRAEDRHRRRVDGRG